MPFTLSRVPLNGADRTVLLRGESVILRPLQPVIWIRLAAWELAEAAKTQPITFPVVVDTGNNGTLLIPESVFRAAVGVSPAALKGRATAPVNGILLACYGFNLDLLRLRGGVPLERVVGRLQTDRGVFLIPTELEHRFPRLPVLGVRCLTLNRLTFSLSGDRRTFSLSQRR
jgi:hypothetical protein